MSDTKNEKTLAERLEETLKRKRAEAQANKDAELLARAAQVRNLQGMLGIVPTLKHTCSKCGNVEIILDPRPIAPDDDYDTRM